MKKFQFVKIDLYHRDFTTEVHEGSTVEEATKKYYDDVDMTDEEVSEGITENRHGGWKIEGDETVICIMEVTE